MLYTRVPTMRASAATTAVLMVVGNAGAEQNLEPSLAPPSIEHPRWEPSWQMNQSTIIMTCNQSGYTTATNVSKFAIVDYDVRPTTAAAATAAATSAPATTAAAAAGAAALLTVMLGSGTTPKRFGRLLKG
jgi:hypothetical protein